MRRSVGVKNKSQVGRRCCFTYILTVQRQSVEVLKESEYFLVDLEVLSYEVGQVLRLFAEHYGVSLVVVLLHQFGYGQEVFQGHDC